MKPAPFAYHRPESVAEALDLMAGLGDDAKALAGGQSLVPMMNFRLARPTHLVDLNRLHELDYVRDEGAFVEVGAMTRVRAVERGRTVADRLPILPEALALVGHPQIRNRGTVGGSLAHADPAAELPALALALDAQLVAGSSTGEMTLPAGEFLHGFFSSGLEPGELLLRFRFPVPEGRVGTGFAEFARRHGDFALAGVAAVLIAGGESGCREARVALLGVADTPVRASEAERILVEGGLGSRTIDEAAEAAMSGLEPASDIHGSSSYRRELAGVMAGRAIRAARQRLGVAADD